MRKATRRRIVAAGAGALAVHLLLALFMARRSPPLQRAVPRKAAPAISVVLTERPAPVVAHEEQHKARVEGPAKAVAHRGGARGAQQATAEAPRPQGGGQSGEGGEPAPWSADWKQREGVAGTGAVSMAPGPGIFNIGKPGPIDGPVREKSREEKLAEEKQDVTRTIEGFLGDVKAKDRAQSAPDTYWRDVREALARGFDPGWDILDRGPDDAGVAKSRFWESWRKQAEQYGKTGSPTEPAERPSLNTEFLSMRNDDRGLDSVSLGGAPTAMINFGVAAASVAGNAFSRKLVATVKVTQRADGSIFIVELMGSSGNLVFDKLAVQQAHKLDQLHLGPPKQGKATLWAFESTFTQVPPAPIAGCALDDFVPKHCWYPLQKLARSRVTLLAIY